jgi:hypothetical protein
VTWQRTVAVHRPGTPGRSGPLASAISPLVPVKRQTWGFQRQAGLRIFLPEATRGGILSSLAGLILFLAPVPTQERLGYYLSPSGLG